MSFKSLLQYADIIQAVCILFILGFFYLIIKIHYNGVLVSFTYQNKKFYYRKKYRVDYLIIVVYTDQKEKLFNFKIINTSIQDKELKNKIKLKIDKYNREGV